MPSAERTITRAQREPVAGATAPFLDSPHIKTGSQPTANRSIGRAAFHGIARSLRRAITDSARAWALAAGIPPDVYN